MAYNPYFPTTYQAFYAQPQAIPQQQFQQPIFAGQQQVQTGIIWVASEKDAQSYPVAPNAAVTLWNQNEPVVYLKQADASGKPFLKTYDLVERIQTASPDASQNASKSVSYVTKDELQGVLATLSGMRGDIDTMRSDLYGLAGKKKTVKKETDENG